MHPSTCERSTWADAAAQYAEPANPAGWSEVNKGICGVMASLAFLLGLAIVVETTPLHGLMAVGLQSWSGGTALPVTIVLVLLFLAGYGFLVLSLLRCLQNAPERRRTKVWLYASMLCAVALPVLILASVLSGFGEPIERIHQLSKALTSGNFRGMYTDMRDFLSSATPMEIDALAMGLLGNFFLVLFFRSVALYFYDGFRARFVELFLLFNAALVAGLAASIYSPALFLAHPTLYSVLFWGIAASGLGNAAIYLSTITCIQGNMSAMRSPLL